MWVKLFDVCFGDKTSILFQIQFHGSTPRLFITAASSPAQPVKNFDFEESQESDFGSLQHLMDEIGAYDAGIKSADDENTSPPVYGCFEVIGGSNHVQSSLSMDGEEEEREIMKCFQVCGKAPEQKKLLRTKNPSIQKSSSCVQLNQVVTHREVQTSVTYVVERNRNRPPTRRAPSQSSSSGLSGRNIDRNHNFFSLDEYEGEEESVASSVYDLYKNKNFVEDSETPHFTALTVTSRTSPPDSPPKKGVPSLAHRVIFAINHSSDGNLFAQMEPLRICDSPESSDDEAPADVGRLLPRFPVHCLISNCDTSTVPSDFCNHITIDHPSIDITRVAPGNLVHLNISTRGNLNMVICHRLFLLTDKIK